MWSIYVYDAIAVHLLLLKPNNRKSCNDKLYNNEKHYLTLGSNRDSGHGMDFHIESKTK